MDEEIKKLDTLDMINLALSIFAGGLSVCRPGKWGRENEWCEEAQLYYPIRGEAWVEVEGKRTLLKPHQLYFLPLHQTKTYGVNSVMAVYWFHFYPQTIWLQRRLAACRRVITFDQAFADRWAATCRLIPRFLQKGATDDACRIQAMLSEVVGVVLTELPQETAEERAAHDRFLPALKLLEKEIGPPPSLVEIARTASLSAEHFHRLFRHNFHTTPLHYATRRRMNQAQQLLSEGRLSVSEVAARCGYDDAFYFSRVFRRHFGVTPKKVSQGHALVTLP